ncbi:hypothetical protein BJ742DRAFT_244347 [Cladochytrium replicatum]|nr:hypothetical protein BJ742DRAFT_244347 [Cladochytrium replicatum]
MIHSSKESIFSIVLGERSTKDNRGGCSDLPLYFFSPNDNQRSRNYGFVKIRRSVLPPPWLVLCCRHSWDLEEITNEAVSRDRRSTKRVVEFWGPECSGLSRSCKSGQNISRWSIVRQEDVEAASRFCDLLLRCRRTILQCTFHSTPTTCYLPLHFSWNAEAASQAPLKEQRMNLPLWNTYAQIELEEGNKDEEHKVYMTALQSYRQPRPWSKLD